jgi:hypothetical protein
VRLLGFVDSAFALPRTLARIMILAAKKPQNCTCAVCYKQPPSLKMATSEIVFGLYNKQKFRFDNITKCKPFEIHEIPEDVLLNIILS